MISCPIDYDTASVQNKTNWTETQQSIYYDQYSFYYCIDKMLLRTKVISYTVSGIIGFVSYILMLATLSRLSMNKCTLIYHKAITVMEFYHMLTLTTYGTYTLAGVSLPKSWWWVLWTGQLANGFFLVNMMKLAISALTAFLSLERFVAVCFPSRFEKINKTSVACCAVSVSLLIGSAHVWEMFSRKIDYDEQNKIYFFTGSWLETNPFYLYVIENVTVSGRLFCCVPIFVFCVCTAIALKRQSTKLLSMSSKAKEDWQIKRKLCILCYITGVCTLADHVMWIVYRICQLLCISPVIGAKAVMQLSYENAVLNFNGWWAVEVTNFIQAYTGLIVHSYRFFFYLAFNKSMRDGCRRLLKLGSETQTQVTSLISTDNKQ